MVREAHPGHLQVLIVSDGGPVGCLEAVCDRPLKLHRRARGYDLRRAGQLRAGVGQGLDPGSIWITAHLTFASDPRTPLLLALCTRNAYQLRGDWTCRASLNGQRVIAAVKYTVQGPCNACDVPWCSIYFRLPPPMRLLLAVPRQDVALIDILLDVSQRYFGPPLCAEEPTVKKQTHGTHRGCIARLAAHVEIVQQSYFMLFAGNTVIWSMNVAHQQTHLRGRSDHRADLGLGQRPRLGLQ